MKTKTAAGSGPRTTLPETAPEPQEALPSPEVVEGPQFPSSPMVPSQIRFAGASVRMVSDTAGFEWFCTADVADILGFAKLDNILIRIPPGERCLCLIKSSPEKEDVTRLLGGSHATENEDVPLLVAGAHAKTNRARHTLKMAFVNEPGLYRMIFRSRLPTAETFKTFVFRDVLPSIRRHGCYPPPPDAKALLDLPLDLKPHGKPGLERFEERYQVAKWLKAISMLQEYPTLSRAAAYHKVVEKMEDYGITVSTLRRYHILFSASGGDWKALIGAQYRAGRPLKRSLAAETGADEVRKKAEQKGLFRTDFAGS